MKVFHSILVCLTISLIIVSISDGDWKKGVAAYEKENYQAAYDEFIVLAQKGDPKAEFAIGEMYQNGKGISRNYSEAAHWFHKSADQGFAPAQYAYGWLLSAGLGIPQDETGAITWYKRAADKGYADAQYTLGLMYANGRGIARNYDSAMMWFKRAADQNQTDAQWNICLMFAKGEGVLQNSKTAHEWCRKSAEQGNAIAQIMLGDMHATGFGVTADRILAAQWYKKAADQGNIEAREKLDEINTNANPSAVNSTSSFQWLKRIIGVLCFIWALMQLRMTLVYLNIISSPVVSGGSPALIHTSLGTVIKYTLFGIIIMFADWPIMVTYILFVLFGKSLINLLLAVLSIGRYSGSWLTSKGKQQQMFAELIPAFIYGIAAALTYHFLA